MVNKRKRTRSGNVGCPPGELPETGSCYTNSDIVSAMLHEVLQKSGPPGLSPFEAAKRIYEKVRVLYYNLQLLDIPE